MFEGTQHYQYIKKNTSDDIFLCYKKISVICKESKKHSLQLYVYFQMNNLLPSKSSLVHSTAVCSPSSGQTKTEPGRKRSLQAGRCHPQSIKKPKTKLKNSHQLNVSLHSNSRFSEVKFLKCAYLRKARLHIELLEHSIHVTSGSTILQPYET